MNGLYVLANDRAQEWLISWFESVRAKGCTLPVCIIPYDDQIDRVSRLAAHYGASILQSDSFPVLDQIGLDMTGLVRHAHFYRKLAMFDGPFDNFLYADSDIIALMNWDELVERFETAESDLWYCGLSAEGAYLPGPLWDELKTRDRAGCINAGFLLSRRGLLTLADIKGLAARTYSVRDQFAETGDQAFVNFWIDHSELKVQSVADVLSDVHSWNWADATYYTGQRDMYEIADRTGLFEGKRFAMIHWAGFSVVSYMPHRELFLKYRLAGATRVDRLYYAWAWRVRPIFGNAKRQVQARFAS